MGRRRLHNDEAVKIAATFFKNPEIFNESNGQYVFPQGVKSNAEMDEWIAKQISPTLDHDHVYRLRHSLYGDLYRSQKTEKVEPEHDACSQLIASLALRVFELEEALTETPAKLLWKTLKHPGKFPPVEEKHERHPEQYRKDYEFCWSILDELCRFGYYPDGSYGDRFHSMMGDLKRNKEISAHQYKQMLHEFTRHKLRVRSIMWYAGVSMEQAS